jgi:site-specific recombinase XerD
VIQFFFERGGSKPGSQVGGIAELLRQVAKHHVRLPPKDVERMSAWKAMVSNRNRQGLSPKNRDRLRPMLSPHGRAKLLHLPEVLLRDAASEENAQRAAQRAEIATALEILLVCPLRLSNLATLRLDENFRRHAPNGRIITHLVIDGADVKNGHAIEWPLPPASARTIQQFCVKFRSTLAAPDNPFLFPGRNGGARSLSGLAGAIIKTVAREAGLEVNVHLFRHFAAHLHLLAHPGEYEIVRRLLGHRSIETTIAFYCGIEAEAAARRADATILAERERTRGLAKAILAKGRRR